MGAGGFAPVPGGFDSHLPLLSGMDQYTYSVAWSDEDQVFIARVAEFALLGAHGDTAAEALEELKAVVAAVVAWQREEAARPVPTE